MTVADTDLMAAPVPRIRVAWARDVPPGAVRIFGSVL
jgi:hypothetical protein